MEDLESSGECGALFTSIFLATCNSVLRMLRTGVKIELIGAKTRVEIKLIEVFSFPRSSGSQVENLP